MATPKRVALALLIAAAPTESGFLRVTTVASNPNNSSNGSGGVKAPEQGYSGKTVQHENMSTSTDDWGKEGGWDEEKERKIQKAQTHLVAIASHRNNSSNGSGPVKAPEQGYSGKTVHHENMSTSTGDWGKEGGWDEKKEKKIQQAQFVAVASHRNDSGNGSSPVKAPEQGYSGKTVHHENMSTSTGDWGKEGGWDEKKERKIQQAQKQLLSKSHVVTTASNESGQVKAPEQGYSGETVHHANMSTSTGDWGMEGGWNEEKEIKLQEAQKNDAKRKQIQSKSQAEADAEAQEETDAEDEAKLKDAEAKAEAKAKAKAEAKAKKEKEEKEKEDKKERSFGSRAAGATLAFALPAAAMLLAAIVQ